MRPSQQAGSLLVALGPVVTGARASTRTPTGARGGETKTAGPWRPQKGPPGAGSARLLSPAGDRPLCTRAPSSSRVPGPANPAPTPVLTARRYQATASTTAARTPQLQRRPQFRGGACITLAYLLWQEVPPPFYTP